METINELLKRLNMHPEQTDIDEVIERFISEMEAGLRGEKSSLAMIPTYISAEGAAPDGSPVIAIDAGGTNLRVGLVSFENGVPVTRDFEKSVMPGSRGEVTTDEFFCALADKIAPLAEKSDIIGFCFSYPMEAFENHDGRIIVLTKEVKVKGAEGLVIGEALMEKLRERGLGKPLRFVVLNDGVACLMGGVARLSLSGAGGLAGLILGTGCNICYLEKGEKIKKLAKPKDMIINCESGNFSGGGGGYADDVLDAASKNPGAYRFEKMMSGVYLGQLISLLAGFASREGLLPAGFESPEGGYFSAPEIDSFLRGEANRVSDLCRDEGDREVLRTIADAVFERAAKLVCAKIAAVCLHRDGGKSPDEPFYLVPEGSVFHNTLLFRGKLEKYLDSHVKEKLHRYIELRPAQDSTMAGTALAALLN